MYDENFLMTWLGVNRTIEDSCRYHVKIFLRTIKIFSPLIISLLEIFIVVWMLVTQLLHWGIIISSQLSRAVIRRQPGNIISPGQTEDWSGCVGLGWEYWKTIFNISDDIKTNHGPGRPEYKNHVTAFVSIKMISSSF